MLSTVLSWIIVAAVTLFWCMPISAFALFRHARAHDHLIPGHPRSYRARG